MCRLPRRHGSDGGALQNWAPNNRYRPNGQGAAADILPNYYKSTDFMDAPKGGEYYQMGDKWFRDRKAPGYGNTTMPNAYDNPFAAEWLGQQFAADSASPRVRWASLQGAVPTRGAAAGTGSDRTGWCCRLAAYNAQQEEFNELAARFAAGGYKVKPC